MNDVVSCIVDVLTKDDIKGYEYAIRGQESITFDGILEALAKHCDIANWAKCRRSYIAGFMERLVIGHTHDKNFVNPSLICR